MTKAGLMNKVRILTAELNTKKRLLEKTTAEYSLIKQGNEDLVKENQRLNKLLEQTAGEYNAMRYRLDKLEKECDTLARRGADAVIERDTAKDRAADLARSLGHAAEIIKELSDQFQID